MSVNPKDYTVSFNSNLFFLTFFIFLKMVLIKTAVLLQKQQLMFFVYMLTEPNTRFKEIDKNNLRFELFFWLFDRWLSGRLELELLSSYGETDGAIFLLTSIIDILAGTAASSCSSSPPCSRFLNMGMKLENLTLQITMASALHHYHTQEPPYPPKQQQKRMKVWNLLILPVFLHISFLLF